MIAFWKNVLFSANAAIGFVKSRNMQHIGASKINTTPPATLEKCITRIIKNKQYCFNICYTIIKVSSDLSTSKYDNGISC